MPSACSDAVCGVNACCLLPLQVLGACSPLTHTLLGQGKTSTIMLLGFIALDYSPGIKSLLGAAVAIAAMIGYTKVNMAENEAKKAMEAQRQRERTCEEMHAVLTTDPEAVSPGGTDSQQLVSDFTAPKVVRVAA